MDCKILCCWGDKYYFYCKHVSENNTVSVGKFNRESEAKFNNTSQYTQEELDEAYSQLLRWKKEKKLAHRDCNTCQHRFFCFTTKVYETYYH